MFSNFLEKCRIEFHLAQQKRGFGSVCHLVYNALDCVMAKEALVLQKV